MRIKVKKQIAAAKLKKISSRLDKIPGKAYQFFRRKTPIDTGNARRRTRLYKGDTIEANYPYADRLDKGWSKQAPIGMSGPTLVYIRKLVRNTFLRK